MLNKFDRSIIKSFKEKYPEKTECERCISFSVCSLCAMIFDENRLEPCSNFIPNESKEWVHNKIKKIFICPFCGRTTKKKEVWCICGARMDGGDK